MAALFRIRTPQLATRHTRCAAVLLALPMLVAPSGVTAQERSSQFAHSQQLRLLPEGDTVRIWAPDLGLKRTRVTVLGWADSTALFERSGRPPDSLTMPFAGMTRMDVLRGKNTGLGILRGASIGGGIGGLVGLLIGEAAVSGCSGYLCELDAFSYMLGGFLFGAGIGPGAGAAHPPDRWLRVDLPVAPRLAAGVCAQDVPTDLSHRCHPCGPLYPASLSCP